MAVPEVEFEKFPAASLPAAALTATAIGCGLHSYRFAVSATAAEEKHSHGDENDFQVIFIFVKTA